MPLKVGFAGAPKTDPAPDVEGNLLLRCLGAVTGSAIELSDPSHADLTLVFPYGFPWRSTAQGVFVETVAKKARTLMHGFSAEEIVRRGYRIPKRSRLLAVSHENLDRRPWQAFGNLIRDGDIPRLTFWPKEIDHGGFRFPYWWNYVDWPEVPRNPSASSRFGALYQLDTLCEEQPITKQFLERKDAAIWVTSHLDFPRRGVLETLQGSMEVDVRGDIPFGKKLQVLREYRYCVVTENSPGYGYETEKVPEARIAGCIPIGFVRNPFSDFDPEAVMFLPPASPPHSLPPLLTQRPSLEALFTYLARVLEGG